MTGVSASYIEEMQDGESLAMLSEDWDRLFSAIHPRIYARISTVKKGLVFTGKEETPTPITVITVGQALYRVWPKKEVRRVANSSVGDTLFFVTNYYQNIDFMKGIVANLRKRGITISYSAGTLMIKNSEELYSCAVVTITSKEPVDSDMRRSRLATAKREWEGLIHNSLFETAPKERWRDSFSNFVEDVGLPRSPRHKLAVSLPRTGVLKVRWVRAETV